MSLFEHNQKFSNIRITKCHPSNRRKSRSIRLSSSTRLSRPSQARANHLRRRLRPQQAVHRVNAKRARIHLPRWLLKIISMDRVNLIGLMCQAVLIKRGKTTRNKVTSKVAKIKVRMDRVEEEDMEEGVIREAGASRGSKEASRASTTIIKWTSKQLSSLLNRLWSEAVWLPRCLQILMLRPWPTYLICKILIPPKSERCCNLFAASLTPSCSKQLSARQASHLLLGCRVCQICPRKTINSSPCRRSINSINPRVSMAKKAKCRLARRIRATFRLLELSLAWKGKGIKKSIKQKISNSGLLKASQSRIAPEIRLRRFLLRLRSTRPTAAQIIKTNNSMADYKLITIPRLWRTLGLTKRPSCLFNKWWACQEVCRSLWTKGVAPRWCKCRCSQACRVASQVWDKFQCKVLRWVLIIAWWCIFARSISLNR